MPRGFHFRWPKAHGQEFDCLVRYLPCISVVVLFAILRMLVEMKFVIIVNLVISFTANGWRAFQVVDSRINLPCIGPCDDQCILCCSCRFVHSHD